MSESESKKVQWIGIDQFEKIYYLYTPHPRKELMEMFDMQSIKNKYIEDGNVIGFTLKGKWIKLYKTIEYSDFLKEKGK